MAISITKRAPAVAAHKELNIICWLVLIVVGLAPVVYGLWPYKYRLYATVQEAGRGGNVAHQFSAWDGSHVAVMATLERLAHDPRSLTHIATTARYDDVRDYLVVRTTFRARNRLGALSIGTKLANVSRHGTVLAIVDEETARFRMP